jgi:hypothetical protein
MQQKQLKLFNIKNTAKYTISLQHTTYDWLENSLSKHFFYLKFNVKIAHVLMQDANVSNFYISTSI